MPNKTKEAGTPQTGRAIVTIIGSDRVGIIAGIANVLADANVNILDISQSVIREFFTMIMMVDLAARPISFEAVERAADAQGPELGVKVEIQREEIFKAMHRIYARCAAVCRRSSASARRKEAAMRHLNFSGEEILETIQHGADREARHPHHHDRHQPARLRQRRSRTLCRKIYDKIDAASRRTCSG